MSGKKYAPKLTGLAAIEQEPPKSLSLVHRLLTEALEEFKTELRKIENEFYDDGNLINEVAKWKFTARVVMEASGFGDIWSSKQLDELERMSVLPTSSRPVKVSAGDVKKLRICVDKIRDFVPGRFQGIIKLLKRILHLFKTYCQSFFNPKTDPFLDTCYNYEAQRRKWINDIETTLERIPAFMSRFDSEHGISVDRFSENVRDMARQLDAHHIHFLFIFPESCERLKICASDLDTWLETDITFATYVRNDLEYKTALKDQLVKKLRDASVHCYKLGFQRKKAEGECEKLDAKLSITQDREKDMLVEEEVLKNTITDIEVDVNIKQYQQEELRKNAGQMHPEVLRETWEKTSSELEKIEDKLPKSKRRLAQIQAKLFWVHEKRKKLSELEKKQEAAQQDQDKAEQERQEIEVEHDEHVRGIATLTRIYRLKTTSDALNRLHYQLPLTPRRDIVMSAENKDAAPLLRACQVISENIDKDWMKLYATLPFIPKRGNTVLETDLLKVQELTSRQGYETQADMALNRWRRHHRRAKVGDLMTALHAIGRNDVAKTVHEDLHPPPKKLTTEEEETRRPAIPADLLPFYKMVERFDALRAQGKI